MVVPGLYPTFLPLLPGDMAPCSLSLVQRNLHDRHFRLVRSLGQLPFLSGPQFPHLYNG